MSFLLVSEFTNPMANNNVPTGRPEVYLNLNRFLHWQWRYDARTYDLRVYLCNDNSVIFMFVVCEWDHIIREVRFPSVFPLGVRSLGQYLLYVIYSNIMGGDFNHYEMIISGKSIFMIQKWVIRTRTGKALKKTYCLTFNTR